MYLNFCELHTVNYIQQKLFIYRKIDFKIPKCYRTQQNIMKICLSLIFQCKEGTFTLHYYIFLKKKTVPLHISKHDIFGS